MNATCHDNVAAFFGVKIKISNGKQIFNLLSRSGDLKSGLVWISNGQKDVGLQMV